ncbi:site-specific integrase [Kitasatospora sp. SUK 42]|uniref:site-specific integrase n=1 Tax=Kitasatospora sp. SUK 42 TaxID=1588882 RepID=UPI0027E35F6D|nr:site-specific integrase [Kitasatospora sp. SUK 42]
MWTPQEAVRFLRYCHAVDPPFADLIELIIGTGMRKGEALALHWNDVHLDHGVLFVRYSLAAVDNNHLVLTTPKTRTSKNWVAISPRVATALRNRAAATANVPGGGLVFQRPDGRPLHPEYVLNHFHDLSRDAGVSRTTVHDLRHLAATISISAGVPLTVVSKTLRHSTLSTTANIYSHLTTQAARDAVNTIDKTLTTIDGVGTPPTRIPRPRPPGDHNPQLHNQLTLTKRPEGATSYRNITHPPPERCDHSATIRRRNVKKAAPARSGNGLRPAVKQVGTTGFEPATP